VAAGSLRTLAAVDNHSSAVVGRSQSLAEGSWSVVAGTVADTRSTEVAAAERQTVRPAAVDSAAHSTPELEALPEQSLSLPAVEVAAAASVAAVLPRARRSCQRGPGLRLVAVVIAALGLATVLALGLATVLALVLGLMQGLE